MSSYHPARLLRPQGIVVHEKFPIRCTKGCNFVDKEREIQILDSLQSRNNCKELLGMKTYLDIAVMENGMQGSRWPDIVVSSWPIIDYEVPRQTDGCSCALWMLKNSQHWTRVRLTAIPNQHGIRQFRKWIVVALINSPHNKSKVRKAKPANDLVDLDLGGDYGDNNVRYGLGGDDSAL
ncbi:uncharacterized protein [Triticum aestivum]|uniref:uncharacterized protein n=1 Tax=Triticum aestivum TaxID=4565 RepID=UPI000844259F|nr:uncharacterized protein LOC123134595 [Triticum aestivum]